MIIGFHRTKDGILVWSLGAKGRFSWDIRLALVSFLTVSKFHNNEARSKNYEV